MRRFAPARSAFAADHDQPLAELNVTPLIDVLLVLLVMLILTIPIMANEVPMDLPTQSKVPAGERVTHRLEIARNGATILDGATLDAAALAARLAVLRSDPKAVLVLRGDPEARYEPFVETLALVKRAGITRLGFEGIARTF